MSRPRAPRAARSAIFPPIHTERVSRHPRPVLDQEAQRALSLPSETPNPAQLAGGQPARLCLVWLHKARPSRTRELGLLPDVPCRLQRRTVHTELVQLHEINLEVQAPTRVSHVLQARKARAAGGNRLSAERTHRYYTERYRTALPYDSGPTALWGGERPNNSHFPLINIKM